MHDLDTALDALAPGDPYERDCEMCGASPLEPCREYCTAWAALVAQVADDDELGCSPAGRIAVMVAADLRAAGVPGTATATTTGGDNVAVVTTWPSGRDRVVAGVEVWAGRAVIYVGWYADVDGAEASPRIEVHDGLSAERAIIAAIGAGQAGAASFGVQRAGGAR